MVATFVVEDGNGLPNANAYVALDYANDYFASRGDTVWSAATDSAKQIAIVKATDYIEAVFGPRFLGAPAFATTGDPTVDQALSFPRDVRTQFVGNTNYADVQYLYTSTSLVVDPLTKPVAMPANLLKATCEYAVRALASATLLPDPKVDASGAQITQKTTTVGPISTSVMYYPNSIQVVTPYPAADFLLKGLIRSGGKSIRG